MHKTQKADLEKAKRMGHKFVEQLRQSNPTPTGEWRVTEEDYDRLEEMLVRKILEVGWHK